MKESLGLSEIVICDRPSPNQGERRGGVLPDSVVLHYTGMRTAEDAAVRLCDPKAEVSAHYLIYPTGLIEQLVHEGKRAWHAGAGEWGGASDINSRSIGIEIANPGHFDGYPPFPEPQMMSLERLLAGVLSRWNIPPERVIGHSCMAPGRKIDPGEKFDWRRLALGGLAVWLDFQDGDDGPGDAGAFQSAATKIGFPVPATEVWCEDTQKTWRSFAMRFLPWRANDPSDAAGVQHAQRIAKMWPCI